MASHVLLHVGDRNVCHVRGSAARRRMGRLARPSTHAAAVLGAISRLLGSFVGGRDEWGGDVR